MNTWSWRYFVALFLAGTGLLLIVVYALNPAFNDFSLDVYPPLAGQFGDLIGGFVGSLFSLSGVLLLFETLIRQQTIFQHQQFEARFLEILRIHRQNVSEMSHRTPQDDNRTVHGRSVFLEMLRQFNDIYNTVKNECANILTKNQIIDVSYLILFYGVGLDGIEMLRMRFSERYQGCTDDLDRLLSILRNRKAQYDANMVYFGGHQLRLGHYFRHLFQSVKFIHTRTFLSKTDKYDYVKTLRAQLSTPELVIFFLNSLSVLGEKWERAVTEDHRLITTYKFIKNIPQGFTFGIDPKSYYKFEYEHEEKS